MCVSLEIIRGRCWDIGKRVWSRVVVQGWDLTARCTFEGMSVSDPSYKVTVVDVPLAILGQRL